MPSESEARTIAKVLRRSGWTPAQDRSRQVEAWTRELMAGSGFSSFSAAEQLLLRYGGLEVKLSGPGIDFAKTSFRIDPSLAAGEKDRFANFEPELGARLYPLGEADGGGAFLAVDERGRVHFLMDEIYWTAPSMDEALAVMILGRRPRPGS